MPSPALGMHRAVRLSQRFTHSCAKGWDWWQWLDCVLCSPALRWWSKHYISTSQSKHSEWLLFFWWDFDLQSITDCMLLFFFLSIIALQYCVSFCYTTKWINYMFTYLNFSFVGLYLFYFFIPSLSPHLLPHTHTYTHRHTCIHPTYWLWFSSILTNTKHYLIATWLISEWC